jgi:hypothetical protein
MKLSGYFHAPAALESGNYRSTDWIAGWVGAGEKSPLPEFKPRTIQFEALSQYRIRYSNY